MPELRWTLLILGVIFIVVLALWERRRPHQASRQQPHIGSDTRSLGNDSAWGPDLDGPNSRFGREPTLTLPEIRTEIRTREPAPPRDLPVVEIPEDSRIGALPEAPPPTVGPDNGAAALAAVRAAISGAVKEAPKTGSKMWPLEAPRNAGSDRPRPPDLSARDAIANKPASPPAGDAIANKAATPARDVETKGAAAPSQGSRDAGISPAAKNSAAPLGVARDAAAAKRGLPPRQPPARDAIAKQPPPQRLVTEDPDAEDVEDEPVAEEAVASTAPEAAASPTEVPAPATNTVPPIVNWPPEAERKLVALRLVARPPERFQGRLVRQALAAEGFVLGDLDIFHKPDAQNRAVLSAASLTKPGTFDLETMDTQRFVGLNLFAVLPGPRSPQKSFEDLLLTARTLNERLEGALQDEHGGPLTPTRIQMIRDSLGSSP